MTFHPHISNNIDETIAECAQAVVTQLDDAIAKRGIARFSLAGGNTPRRLYRHLAEHYRQAIDWSRIEFYFGDERIVPLDHPDSNFLMASTTLFTPLGIPRQRIFPLVSGQNRDPQLDAEQYTRQLNSWASGRIPTFDLCLLGMGSDGHFASIFPDTPAEHERDRLVMVNPVKKINSHRLTLTFPVFEQARAVFFLVTGADKQEAVTRVKAGKQELPAELLTHLRDTKWFIDPDAAGHQVAT